MELMVLAVPDCPGVPVLEERLAAVLADLPQVPVARMVIGDEAGAARSGMHGSPTLLVDGADPFAGPDAVTSMSCRLYRGEDGRMEWAPSVAELRRVLGAAQARR